MLALLSQESQSAPSTCVLRKISHGFLVERSLSNLMHTVFFRPFINVSRMLPSMLVNFLEASPNTLTHWL